MATNFNLSVAGEIRAHVARKQLSRERVAISLGWSPAYLSRRMSGEVAWSTDDIEAVARLLGVPIAELTSPRAAS